MLFGALVPVFADLNGDGYEDLVTMAVISNRADYAVYYPDYDYHGTYSYEVSKSKELQLFYGMFRER
jgi:hypothetical protein